MHSGERRDGTSLFSPRKQQARSFTTCSSPAAQGTAEDERRRREAEEELQVGSGRLLQLQHPVAGLSQVKSRGRASYLQSMIWKVINVASG